MPKDNFQRSNDHCLRANRDDGQEQGIIEGYFARWGQVDSHNTRFQKGCFAKSIKERMNKIVIRNSHGNPIGKPLEIREDDKGAFFSGQVSLGVQEAREAFELVRDSVVTGLSFGFQNVNDKIESDGIRTFTEVKLLEISPTWLPSGDDSRITDVRSGEDDIDKRGESFEDTVLENTSSLLWNSIQNTISDIWWAWAFDEIDNATMMVKTDEALSAFRDSYVEFTSQWITRFGNEGEDDSQRTSINELQMAVASTLKREERTVQEYCTEHNISEDVMQSLRRGQHVADLEKVANVPEELRTLNNQLRATQFENAFTELRTMMSSGEIKRADALLRSCGNIKPTKQQKEKEPELRSDEILSLLKTINGEDTNV